LKTEEVRLVNVTWATDYVPFYLTVYGGIALANCVFTLSRAFLFAYGWFSNMAVQTGIL
jgi:hypothetical protein